MATQPAKDDPVLMTEQTYDEPTMPLTQTMRLRPLGAATAQVWARDFVFHSVGAVTSVIGFTLWVTAVSITLSLLIFLIGLLVALGAFYCFRWFARLERRRAALVLDAPIGERYRDAPKGSGWFQKLKFMAKDPATWKDFTWCLLGGTVAFTVAEV